MQGLQHVMRQGHAVRGVHRHGQQSVPELPAEYVAKQRYSHSHNMQERGRVRRDEQQARVPPLSNRPGRNGLVPGVYRRIEIPK